MISVTKTKTIAFVAAFSGANAALRVLPPNVKPTAFLVIVRYHRGPMAGVAVGWLSMTLSDLYFGAASGRIRSDGLDIHSVTVVTRVRMLNDGLGWLSEWKPKILVAQIVGCYKATVDSLSCETPLVFMSSLAIT